jgi:hypothetical protein
MSSSSERQQGGRQASKCPFSSPALSLPMQLFPPPSLSLSLLSPELHCLSLSTLLLPFPNSSSSSVSIAHANPTQPSLNTATADRPPSLYLSLSLFFSPLSSDCFSSCLSVRTSVRPTSDSITYCVGRAAPAAAAFTVWAAQRQQQQQQWNIRTHPTRAWLTAAQKCLSVCRSVAADLCVLQRRCCPNKWGLLSAQSPLSHPILPARSPARPPVVHCPTDRSSSALPKRRVIVPFNK